MMTGFVAAWDAEKQYFPPVFTRAMAFARDVDTAAITPGRVELEGKDIFAIVTRTTTRPAASIPFEIHAEYLDIQVLLTGREGHGYYPGSPARLSNLTMTSDELATRDAAFYEHPQDAQFFTMEPMQYAVYLPYELHCPLCAAPDPCDVLKVVLKIRKNLV